MPLSHSVSERNFVQKVFLVLEMIVLVKLHTRDFRRKNIIRKAQKKYVTYSRDLKNIILVSTRYETE